MKDEQNWKLWIGVIAAGVIAIAFVLGVLMGRIAWPFDVLMYLIGK